MLSNAIHTIFRRKIFQDVWKGWRIMTFNTVTEVTSQVGQVNDKFAKPPGWNWHYHLSSSCSIYLSCSTQPWIWQHPYLVSSSRRFKVEFTSKFHFWHLKIYFICNTESQSKFYWKYLSCELKIRAKPAQTNEMEYWK